VNEINVDEFQKVFCARSFANLRWWTLYPRNDSVENDAALIYDDESSAFSTYSINMNCLGYGNFGQDFGLNDFIAANNLDFSLNEMGEDTLQDYFWQDNQETFLGGNIEGTVLVLETDGDDNGDDIDCDLWTAGWNPYQSQGKEAQLSYIDFYIDTDLATVATVEFYKDDDTAPYASQQLDFLPNLNFIAAVNNVSLTNPVNINAPQHGLLTGATIFIYNVVGTVEVNGGPYLITVVDENNFTLDGVDGTGFSPFFSSGGVYLRQFYKTKTWKRAFGGGIGYVHRVRIRAGGRDRPFRFHAFKPYFKPRGSRTIN
jgi:hypothetical protein